MVREECPASVPMLRDAEAVPLAFWPDDRPPPAESADLMDSGAMGAYVLFGKEIPEEILHGLPSTLLAVRAGARSTRIGRALPIRLVAVEGREADRNGKPRGE